MTVRSALIFGLGSGLSAPWPMPTVAIAAAAAAARERAGSRLARICQSIGLMQVIGTLVEPVTWARRSHSPVIWATVATNLTTGAALAFAGRRSALTLPPNDVALGHRSSLPT
jgi:hypothetical protein